MTQKLYTRYQKDHADVLLSRSKFWTWGRRKRDGLSFVVFPSSRATAEKPIAYYTTASACSCPSFQHRGSCAHELSVRMEAEQARAAFSARAEQYDDDDSLRYAF
jgi:hypothetical protein